MTLERKAYYKHHGMAKTKKGKCPRQRPLSLIGNWGLGLNPKIPNQTSASKKQRASYKQFGYFKSKNILLIIKDNLRIQTESQKTEFLSNTNLNWNWIMSSCSSSRCFQASFKLL